MPAARLDLQSCDTIGRHSKATQEKENVTSFDVKIRVGTKSDSVAAWRLFQNHLNWINVWNDTSNVIQRRQDGEFMNELFKLYPSVMVEYDDTAIGFLATEGRELGVLEVVNMYIDDSFRNFGLGGNMLRLLEAQCRVRGIHNIVGWASEKYFPGKRLPTTLFQKSGYSVADLGHGVEMYLKGIELSPEEATTIHPVRRLDYLTVTDLAETEMAIVLNTKVEKA